MRNYTCNSWLRQAQPETPGIAFFNKLKKL